MSESVEKNQQPLDNSIDDQKGHPVGLYLLFVTEMAERFSYYGMRALFVLYLISAFFSNGVASEVYGSYTGLVYLTPLIGGYVADKYWGNRRSIIVGGLVMALGQFLMFLSACFVSKALPYGPSQFQKLFTDSLHTVYLDWPTAYGPIDTTVDNNLSLFLMICGLVALILGNGFFKPNISTMVGDLYKKSDKRRDSAFSIFYMGINVGAFIAPIVCGAMAISGSWYNPGGYRWGFLCACIGMCLSVIVFWALKDKLLVTPEGVPIGMPRTHEKHEETVKEASSEDSSTEKAAKNSPVRMIGCLAAAIILFLIFLFSDIVLPIFQVITGSLSMDAYSALCSNFLSEMFNQPGMSIANNFISSTIYACSIALPVYIITDKSLSTNEKKHIGVIYIIALFVVFFWSAFEQAGSSLTIFADRQCDRYTQIPAFFKTVSGWLILEAIVIVATAIVTFIRCKKIHGFNRVLSGIINFAIIQLVAIILPWIVMAIGGFGLTSWEMPTPWFQSVNPIVVVTFAPIMAVLWQFLGKRGIEPSSPVKQAIGLMLLSIGYFIITYATYGVDSATKISMLWLLILYFVHTMGELCLSPIGLSMVTKLAPRHLASLLMGVWFMSNATSNILAGKLAKMLPEHGQEPAVLFGQPISTLDQFFLVFAIMAGVASILLFAICPVLKWMMKDIEEADKAKEEADKAKEEAKEEAEDSDDSQEKSEKSDEKDEKSEDSEEKSEDKDENSEKSDEKEEKSEDSEEKSEDKDENSKEKSEEKSEEKSDNSEDDTK